MGKGVLYQRIDVGEDAQPQDLLVDTGSSWTWVDSYTHKNDWGTTYMYN